MTADAGLQLGTDLAPALREAWPKARVTSCVALAGQASSRRYFRLELAGAPVATAVVMRLPDDPALAFGSDEGAEQAGAPGEERLPFLDVQRFLASRGLPVPRVYAADLPRRVVLLEDVGDESFEARLRVTAPEAWTSPYGAAVDLLAEFQRRCRRRDGEAPARVHQARFTGELLRWELDHFREWGLEALRGPLRPSARRALDAHFDALASSLARSPYEVVHRDYQSRNLHWRGTELVLLDFQDAFQGPALYDLVALLNDGYVEVPGPLEEAMRSRFADVLGPFDDGLYEATVVHRKLKDAGRFVYIDRVRGDASFLPHVGRCLAYVDAALGRWDTAAARALHGLLRSELPGFPRDVEVGA